MPTTRIQATYEMKGAEKLRGELDGRGQAIVKKAAFDIERNAKERAPVDTGALRSSIYTVLGWGGSGYGKAKGDAQSRRKDAKILTEIPAQGLEAVVAVGVEYGIYVEFGTRRMGAQPYLGPAVEKIRPEFEAAMKELVK